ncbi:MAG: bifunctional riboflavin kinase/FAD synthetase [Thermodesulfobacteriota bacterium]
MEHIRDRWPAHPFQNPVVTLGNFDGVHLGHQRIFRLLIERAAQIGGPSVVYTFEPHPIKVLYPDRRMPLITSYEERAALVEQLGVDVLVSAPFDQEFARQGAHEFVEEVLVRGIGAKQVLVGYDYAFGRHREGNTALLRRLGREMGFGVEIVPPVMLNGAAVSSSRIRAVVEEQGDVALAAKMMGRHFSIHGKVVRGHRRGKSIGYPTANLSLAGELLPKPGVYAVTVTRPGRPGLWGGMANLGTNPTFGDAALSFEVHIFDFHKDIYGQELRVAFVERLREERRFPSVEELVAQLRRDEELSRSILSSRSTLSEKQG